MTAAFIMEAIFNSYGQLDLEEVQEMA